MISDYVFSLLRYPLKAFDAILKATSDESTYLIMHNSTLRSYRSDAKSVVRVRASTSAEG